jgi:hypothetical protein
MQLRVYGEPVDPQPWAVGDTVRLDDSHDWTVQAATDHFHALTRPVTDRDRDEVYAEYEAPDDCDDGDCDHFGCHSEPPDLERGTTWYTVVDWRGGVRGPCNLVGQSWGDGTYSEDQCAAMLAEFESGKREVSHRNRVRLGVVAGVVQ